MFLEKEEQVRRLIKPEEMSGAAARTGNYSKNNKKKHTIVGMWKGEIKKIPLIIGEKREIVCIVES